MARSKNPQVLGLGRGEDLSGLSARDTGRPERRRFFCRHAGVGLAGGEEFSGVAAETAMTCFAQTKDFRIKTVDLAMSAVRAWRTFSDPLLITSETWAA